jgi:GT2 family glycosyltransferase
MNMPKLLPKIPPEDIQNLLPNSVDQSKIKGDLIELAASATQPQARKRFYRLRLNGSPDLHLSYGEGLKETYERSKAFNAALPQYTCKPVFIVEDGERHLFGQEFFEGTPIDEKYSSNKIDADGINEIISTIHKKFSSLEVESTHQAFGKEYEAFKETILKNDSLQLFDKSFLNNCVFPNLEESLLPQSFSVRWSPGDLATRNILVDDELSFRIIDCEFAHKTHFHKEDWLRLAVFSSGSFKEIASVKERLDQVEPWYHIYLYLRQTWLNRLIWKDYEYQCFAGKDLYNTLNLTGRFDTNNEGISLLIRGILDASRKSLVEISVEKEIRLQKESELDSEKELRLQKESELNSEKELRLQKEIELNSEKELRLQKESELDSEKELIFQIEKELDNEKHLKITKEAELNYKSDKINIMERSFSWKVTGFLRYLRRQFLDKKIKQHEEQNNNLNHQFSITYENYLKSICFPNSISKDKKDIVIIIPVYFALEYLSKCILSIERFYPKLPIFVIDDSNSKSASIKLKKLLKSSNISRNNIHIITNNLNIGFVQSVNKAILEVSNIMTPKHILLLNSDTELTDGCIDEMKAVIETSDRHGAVSPRSNNASIQTFPYSSEVDFVKSYDVWNKNKHHLPRYHIIPTCVGFCMLIRYELIKRYGMFSEIYGKGYNEENDFCSRINRFGYSSVSSNHSFVFHHSSRSFTENEKIVLEDKNRIKLDHIYPEYKQSIELFHKKNSQLKYEKSFFYKKKLLFDLQDITAHHNGTSEFAIRILNGIYCINSYFELYILISRKSFCFHKSELPSAVNVIYLENQEEIFFDLTFRPMQFFTPESLEKIQSISNKLVFVMQDIITIRTNYLSNSSLIDTFSKSLEAADKIITISNFVHDDLNSYFNNSINTKVIHHGLDENISPSHDKNYILIVGNKFHHKSVVECINEISNLKFNFKVLGVDSQSHGYDHIEFIPSGKLSNNEINELYKNCSLIIYPSSYEGFGLPICHSIRFSKHIICFENQLNLELKEYFGFFKGISLIQSFRDLGKCIESLQEQNIPPFEIKENFTWKNKAHEYYSTLKKVLA